MQLSQTNSGNWAKQVTISGGSKWRFCGNFATREQAEAAAAIHAAKGRKISVTEETTSKSQAKKHSRPRLLADGTLVTPHVEVGQKFFRLEAYVEASRQVMQHASAAECAAAGKTPGPCNL